VRDERPAWQRGPWQAPRKTSPLLGIVALLILAAGAAYLWLAQDNPQTTPESASLEQSVAGAPYAVDGDTLEFGDRRVRLVGIDAPELAQTCKDASGKTWTCGAEAQRQLKALVANGGVTCTSTEYDEYGRDLGRCMVGKRNINAVLVKTGWAVSYGDYRPEQKVAKAAKAGIWRGSFVTPAYWRDGLR
jgi:endonuclease YncB( thermonuclease family)